VAPRGAAVFRDLRVCQHGRANSTGAPRHMLCLGYGAERDPQANSSHLGAGKQPQLFSGGARHTLASRREGVDVGHRPAGSFR
jgi:hypothetical protein